jgi:hypothetical protein
MRERKILEVEMSDEVPPPRFLVRMGNRGFMVWDRQAKGPAKFNGRQAVQLTEEQARELKDHLMRLHTPKA